MKNKKLTSSSRLAVDVVQVVQARRSSGFLDLLVGWWL